MMNHLAERVVEDECGARKVEGKFLQTAAGAKACDVECWVFRHSTLRTERRAKECHLRPACRTNGPPSAFADLNVAEDTRERKQEIQYGVGKLRVQHGWSPVRRKGQGYFSISISEISV